MLRREDILLNLIVTKSKPLENLFAEIVLRN